MCADVSTRTTLPASWLRPTHAAACATLSRCRLLLLRWCSGRATAWSTWRPVARRPRTAIRRVRPGARRIREDLPALDGGVPTDADARDAFDATATPTKRIPTIPTRAWRGGKSPAPASWPGRGALPLHGGSARAGRPRRGGGAAAFDRALQLGHPDAERMAAFQLWRGRSRDAQGQRARALSTTGRWSRRITQWNALPAEVFGVPGSIAASASSSRWPTCRRRSAPPRSRGPRWYRLAACGGARGEVLSPRRAAGPIRGRPGLAGAGRRGAATRGCRS